jgi:hypothetical protein
LPLTAIRKSESIAAFHGKRIAGHWGDNEVAHQAFMRRCRIEVAVLIA